MIPERWIADNTVPARVSVPALLGAVGGVLIADYFLVRRTRLDLQALYQWPVVLVHGRLPRRRSPSPGGGVIPCVPGSLATVGLVEVMLS